ncbi:MAG TPA: hypothetical protein PK393_01420 [Synergistaceae bacterium]|nr:hypothetical protein [Synergistaceae bacterium]HQF90586.1 hypothetical protein [Synergistaceae bacterium]HQH77680.1 hypothetical protein [Synergistaceae bacterium]HQK24164.1 hypothetical protein [Synergistaceae bacterium]
MERKIRRVQRWLDRCLEACRIGQWQAALAEMECARTDLDLARRALWDELSAVDKSTRRRPFRGGAALRGALVGALVILAVAHPLAFDDPSGAPSPSLVPEIVAFVTRDEQSLILALRTRLGEGALRQGAGEWSQLSSEEEGALRRDAGARAAGRGVPPERKSPSGAGRSAVLKEDLPRATEGGGLPAEDLLALVQVGERALRDASVRVVGD